MDTLNHILIMQMIQIIFIQFYRLQCFQLLLLTVIFFVSITCATSFTPKKEISIPPIKQRIIQINIIEGTNEIALITIGGINHSSVFCGIQIGGINHCITKLEEKYEIDADMKFGFIQIGGINDGFSLFSQIGAKNVGAAPVQIGYANYGHAILQIGAENTGTTWRSFIMIGVKNKSHYSFLSIGIYNDTLEAWPYFYPYSFIQLGIYNNSRNSARFQLGFVNNTKVMALFQAGMVNTSEYGTYIQTGLYNSTSNKNTSLQIGLLNHCHSPNYGKEYYFPILNLCF